MTREEALSAFLQSAGWGDAKLTLLAHDASFRWYDRLTKSDGTTAVLMNAPIPQEDPGQFAFVDEILERVGLKPPHIIARDLENGFLLLEDLGDDTFTRLINKGADEMELYSSAIWELIKLQKAIKTNPGLGEYDEDVMLFEASLLPLWYVKYVVGTELDQSALDEFTAIWKKLFKILNNVPKSLVLLDYHVDNLMITPKGQCAVLDFQDARFGPITYDLAALLEDARRPVKQEIQDAMQALFLKELPEFDTPEFRSSYALVAAQRHSKVIGIFVRLFKRDNKPRYLKHIPFVWSLLEKHLDDPLLKEYKDWLDKYVPHELRHKVPFEDMAK